MIDSGVQSSKSLFRERNISVADEPPVESGLEVVVACSGGAQNCSSDPQAVDRSVSESEDAETMDDAIGHDEVN